MTRSLQIAAVQLGQTQIQQHRLVLLVADGPPCGFAVPHPVHGISRILQSHRGTQQWIAATQPEHP